MIEPNKNPSTRPLFDDLSGPVIGPLVSTPDFNRQAYKAADRDTKNEHIRNVTTLAYEQLAQDLSRGKSESLKAYLRTASKFHHYSFNNCMLIMLQYPEATRVAGFRAWSKFNRFVRKGEEGIVVMAPVTKIVGTTEETGADGKKRTTPVRRVVNTKPVYVFDVSQTDGEPLPTIERQQGDPGDYLNKLERLFEDHDIKLEYVPTLGGAEGVSRKGEVAVLEGLEPAKCFSVLVHELAHELLHRDAERRKETTVTVRETEAEAVAFIVGTGVELDVGTASSDYIQLYRGSVETLTNSLHAIKNTASRILTRLL